MLFWSWLISTPRNFLMQADFFSRLMIVPVVMLPCLHIFPNSSLLSILCYHSRKMIKGESYIFSSIRCYNYLWMMRNEFFSRNWVNMMFLNYDSMGSSWNIRKDRCSSSSILSLWLTSYSIFYLYSNIRSDSLRRFFISSRSVPCS